MRKRLERVTFDDAGEPVSWEQSFDNGETWLTRPWWNGQKLPFHAEKGAGIRWVVQEFWEDLKTAWCP
ncbi:MAG TPA: hypothetical protein VN682_16895 [Terriglobales bacterium]|nr:hypothetical protein [Terriglobales bacterium]